MKLVPVHVIAAAIALVSGFIALYAFKGRTLHRNSGTIFAYAMLVMSLSGAVMAVGRASAAINIPVALVTAYLVITSLATVRPPSSRSRRLDRRSAVGAGVGASMTGIGLVMGSTTGGAVAFEGYRPGYEPTPAEPAPTAARRRWPATSGS